MASLFSSRSSGDGLRGGSRHPLAPCHAVLLAVLLCLSGCGPSSQPGPGGGSGKGKIAVVVSTLNNPWFVVLKNAAVKRAEELGYEAVEFDSENDTAKETAHFENIIVGGYQAILFNPTDADSSISNVKRAKQAGIPVFCMDREINSNQVAVSQLFSDNYSGCVDLGQYFVKTVNKGKYAELLGLVGDNNTWNRSQGFHSVVDRYPDLEAGPKQSADFDRDKAFQVMQDMLRGDPDIVAVFCGNDAMAMGALKALQASGKADQVKVFGYDGAADVIHEIQQGNIEATVMQFPKVMAARAAEWADRYLQQGKRDFEQKVRVPVELVTQQNVQNYQGYGKKERETP